MLGVCVCELDGRYSHFILLTTPILIIYYWFTWLVIPLPFFSSSFILHLQIIIRNKYNSSCLQNLFWSLMICWSIIILCFFLLFSFTQFNAKSNPFHHILIYTYSFCFYFIWFYIQLLTIEYYFKIIDLYVEMRVRQSLTRVCAAAISNTFGGGIEEE